MKSLSSALSAPSAPSVLLLASVSLLMLAIGCATPPTDWANRVGTYTYDQAVTDLGPPDKQAKLADGRVEAEWIRRYDAGAGENLGPGRYYGSPTGVGIVDTQPVSYESSLWLTFNTNHVLMEWSKQ